jgi:hypothetical protein
VVGAWVGVRLGRSDGAEVCAVGVAVGDRVGELV